MSTADHKWVDCKEPQSTLCDPGVCHHRGPNGETCDLPPGAHPTVPGQEKQFVQALLDWYDGRPEDGTYVWCPEKKKWGRIIYGSCGYEGCKECGEDTEYSSPHEDEAEEELIRRLREFVGQGA